MAGARIATNGQACVRTDLIPSNEDDPDFLWEVKLSASLGDRRTLVLTDALSQV